MSKDNWIQFNGFRQLAKWLIDTKRGTRFLQWFGRNYFRKLMSTAAGAEFHEELRKEVEQEFKDRRPMVVIETHPDGFIRVYSDGASVSFVNRLATYQRCEALDEERCWMDCGLRQRNIYLNERILVGCENVRLHPQTLSELVESNCRKDLHRGVDRAKQSRG